MFLVAYEKEQRKAFLSFLEAWLTPSIKASFALAKHKLPHYITPPLPSGSGLSNFSQIMAQITLVCVTAQHKQHPSYAGPVWACAVTRAGCGPIIWMVSVYIIRDNHD